MAQVPYEQTKAINQWRSVGKSPFSDECLVQLTSEDRYDDSGNLLVEEETRGVYLTCTYEEDIATASAQRRFASKLPSEHTRRLEGRFLVYLHTRPGNALRSTKACVKLDQRIHKKAQGAFSCLFT